MPLILLFIQYSFNAQPLNNPSLLLPYEQHYIQSLHQAGRLIPEQSPGETNPLFQMAINPQPPHPTSAGQ